MTKTGAGTLEIGRDALLAELVRQHSQLVYRIALTVVRNPTDAEDVVQETFLQLLRRGKLNPTRGSKLDEIRESRLGDIQDRRGYLARVAWRLAVRKKQRLPPEELPPNLPSAEPSPEAAAINSQTQAWLHSQIDALPERLRRPLALAALGELSSPEVARILGIPEGTVRRRIHTARQLLMQQWEKRKGGVA